MRQIRDQIRRLTSLPEDELYVAAKELQAPYELVVEVAWAGKLPVTLFTAGGIATPADAAMMMQLGAEGVFVGSGIFKSGNPAQRPPRSLRRPPSTTIRACSPRFRAAWVKPDWSGSTSTTSRRRTASPNAVGDTAGGGPGIIRDDVASGRGVVGGVHLEWSVACNVGRVREANEDGAVARAGVFLIADGMGGHDCGEIASEIALTVLSGGRPGVVKPRPATSWSNYSSPRRTRSAKSTPPASGAPARLSLAPSLVEHDETPHWLVANIGDSRTYCVRDGVFER